MGTSSSRRNIIPKKLEMKNQDYLNKRYDFVNAKQITQGKFSIILRSVDKENNDLPIVIKKLNKNIIERILENKEEQKKFKESIPKESSLLEDCKSEYTVKLYEAFETFDDFYLILEDCPTDLRKYLYEEYQKPESIDKEELEKTQNYGFSPKEIRSLFSKLNTVFKIMNKKNILHRDLKLQNILIKYDEKKNLIPVLCDFGIGRVLINGEATTIGIGTPNYMAPEIMPGKDKGQYNESVDLWSIGIILSELYFRSLPYEGINFYSIKKRIKKPRMKISDPILESLVSGLLKEEPNERLTYKQYFKHPFWKQKD